MAAGGPGGKEPAPPYVGRIGPSRKLFLDPAFIDLLKGN